jgi:hypothetical protein
MTTCSRTLRAYRVDAPSRTELPISLYYRDVDPYEVTIAISAHIEWKLSREMLQAGTSQPVGEGDVHLWPGFVAPRRKLFLHLSSPSGQALLELPHAAVLEFLQETEILVPTGTETAAFSFEAELQALLDGDPS